VVRLLRGLLRPLRILSPWWLVRRLVVLVVVLYLGATFVEVWLVSQRDGAVESQAIVVMGAAQYDGRPSPVLRTRLDHAIDLYEQKLAPLVIVTGGRQEGDRMTEASASARYLIRNGIPDSAIRREVDGTNTYESLAASRRFLAREGVSEVILVTDAYHAARVAATARELGLSPRTSPVGTAPMGRIVRETAAMAVGRVIGFRRLAHFG
jgi:uncharacterized SAM-binding protein YcdF (DUF218 family)